MRGGSLAVRIFGGFGLVILLTLAVAGIVFFSLLGGYRDALNRDTLQDVADQVFFAVRRQAERIGPAGDFVLYLQEQADETGAVVLILDQDGRVFRDLSPAARFDDARLPITADEAGRRGGQVSWIEVPYAEDGEDLVFLARIFPVDRFRGALVAIAAPGRSVGSLVADLAPRLALAGVAGLGVALLVAYGISRSLYGPLRSVTHAAALFGRGRYDTRVPEAGPEETRALARSFNRMAAEVQANDRTLQEFMADVSHELRTPLTSVRGFTQALLDGTVTDPERQARSVQVIDDEARRMLRLVEQLLDLSRMEAGELRMQLEPVDLEELLRHVADVFQQRADDAGLSLAVETDESLPSPTGDFDRLVQVVTNLVANALEHTQEGGVTLSAHTEDGAVRVTVADTGNGIAPEHLPRLFDRFYRAGDGRRRGTGLGLAISREIVRAHGGEIWAESAPGAGTRVHCRLPLRPAA